MFVFDCLAVPLVCIFTIQGVVAGNHGPLGNRNMHHRHHFAHEHHPTTLAATPDSTSSSAPRPTSTISRFVTSTISTTFPTSLVSRADAPDISESDNATPADSPDSDTTTLDETSNSDSTPGSVQLITKTSRASLTPNGIKAGIAGGDAYPFFKDHIGWWYDWYGFFSIALRAALIAFFF